MRARPSCLFAPVLKRGAMVFALALGAAGAGADGPAGGGVLLERTVAPGAGDRFTRVDFTCWLPEPGRPVRAVIIHQHGCGNSSAAANPPVARDFHWQALARQHDCAVLVPHYTVAGDCAEWNDPDSGSERALLAALRDFGARTARPELEIAPWILWGHSGGSSWGMQMVLRHRARILAASLRGGAHKQFGDAAFRARFAAAAHDLPLLFVWGRGETVPASRHFVSWEPMQAMYRELRAAGGHVALAIDPRQEHDCGNSRLLVMPFFDAVLAAHRQQTALSGVWVDTATREFAGGRAKPRSRAGLAAVAVCGGAVEAVFRNGQRRARACAESEAGPAGGVGRGRARGGVALAGRAGARRRVAPDPNPPGWSAVEGDWPPRGEVFDHEPGLAAARTARVVDARRDGARWRAADLHAGVC